MPDRVRRFETATDDAFRLAADGSIEWERATVARLVPGEQPLAPQIEILPSDYVDGPGRERLRRRLVQWLERLLADRLGPLVRLGQAALPGPARGIAYQLVEALGLLPRDAIRGQLDQLAPADRRSLAQAGVELGEQTICCRGLANPRTMRFAGQLWAIAVRRPLPALPTGRPASFLPTGEQTEGFLHAIGYRRIAGMAVRADALERLARQARQLGRQGAFLPTETLRQTVGCAEAALPVLLRAMGFRQTGSGEEASFAAQAGRKNGKARPSGGRQGGGRRPADPGSPFAVLTRLKIGR
jgi:ATP-dependent RNA helicase SUPV3L1/SUV3